MATIDFMPIEYYLPYLLISKYAYFCQCYFAVKEKSLQQIYTARIVASRFIELNVAVYIANLSI